MQREPCARMRYVASACWILAACVRFPDAPSVGADVAPEAGTDLDGSGGGVLLTVVKAGSASGTVVSTPPGIDCGAACAHAYDAGTMVTLTALPDADATLNGWAGGACAAGASSCTVTLEQASTITATFDLTLARACELAGADPINDSCGTARDITAAASAPGGTRIIGTTAGHDDVGGIVCFSTQGNDFGGNAVFKLVAAAGQTLEVEVVAADPSTNFKLWDAAVHAAGDTCADPTSCHGVGPSAALTVPNSVATTHYVSVDSASGDEGCFVLRARLF